MSLGSSEQKAWVVFSGKTDVPWLRLLKPGFRHCFVLLHDGRNWLSVDPMLNRMEVQLQYVPPRFKIFQWLEDHGYTVVSAPVCRDKLAPAPWRLFTCVEAVKRILGIHARGIFTPWQLYKHLTQEKGA